MMLFWPKCVARIQGHRLKLKEAEAAIINATFLESAARPCTHIDAPEDRAEGEARDDPQMHFSADPDARWVKKVPNPRVATKPSPARIKKASWTRSTPSQPTVLKAQSLGVCRGGSKAQRRPALAPMRLAPSGHSAMRTPSSPQYSARRYQ